MINKINDNNGIIYSKGSQLYLKRIDQHEQSNILNSIEANINNITYILSNIVNHSHNDRIFDGYNYGNFAIYDKKYIVTVIYDFNTKETIIEQITKNENILKSENYKSNDSLNNAWLHTGIGVFVAFIFYILGN